MHFQLNDWIFNEQILRKRSAVTWLRTQLTMGRRGKSLQLDSSRLWSPIHAHFPTKVNSTRRFALLSIGSPGFSMTTPPSPSSCNQSDVFFNFDDLRNPQTDDFYGSPRPPQRFRSHSFSVQSTRFACSPHSRFQIANSSLFVHSRERLSSQGHDMTDDEDDEEPNHLIDLMTLRENMQEFPGRVPQRKRKKDSESPPQDGSKPKVRIISSLSPRRVELSPSSTHPKECGLVTKEGKVI